MRKQLILCMTLCLWLLDSTEARSKYVSEEEDNPYEFGFTIDGQQHRHEKKDANGVIQGEFGFITADGIYHVTVYATDEHGNFKILSMRNVRVSGPLDEPNAKLPDTSQFSKGQPSPAPNPLSINTSPAPVQTVRPVTESHRFTTQATIKPACAGCGYVTHRTPLNTNNNNLPFQTQAGQNPKPGSVVIGNAPQTPDTPQSPIHVLPEQPSFDSQKSDTSSGFDVPPGSNAPFVSPGTQGNQGQFNPQDNYPGTRPQSQYPVDPNHTHQKGNRNYNTPATPTLPQTPNSQEPHLQLPQDNQRSLVSHSPQFPSSTQAPQSKVVQNSEVNQQPPSGSHNQQTPQGAQDPQGPGISQGNQNDFEHRPGSTLPESHTNTTPTPGLRPVTYITSNTQSTQAPQLRSVQEQSQNPSLEHFAQDIEAPQSHGVEELSRSVQQTQLQRNSNQQAPPIIGSRAHILPQVTQAPQSRGVQQTPLNGQQPQSIYNQQAPQVTKTTQDQTLIDFSSSTQTPQSIYNQQTTHLTINSPEPLLPHLSHSTQAPQSLGVQQTQQNDQQFQHIYNQEAPQQFQYQQHSQGQQDQDLKQYRDYTPHAQLTQTPTTESGTLHQSTQQPQTQQSINASMNPLLIPDDNKDKFSEHPQQDPLLNPLTISNPNNHLNQPANNDGGGASGITVANGQINVPNNPPIKIQDKFPNMVDGLPEGITQGDITDLLYRFNYTVGFHGHYEKGYKNGAKVGGYFVNDRDGVSRIVTYVADENGYRPKVKFIRLDLNSDLVPKEGSEKTFGLKNFEFVWYPLN